MKKNLLYFPPNYTLYLKERKHYKSKKQKKNLNKKEELNKKSITL